MCARATAGSRPAPAGAASFNGSLALGGVSALCYKAAAVEAAYREYLLLLECGLKSLPRVDGNLTSVHAMVLRSPTAKVGNLPGQDKASSSFLSVGCGGQSIASQDDAGAYYTGGSVSVCESVMQKGLKKRQERCKKVLRVSMETDSTKVQSHHDIVRSLD